MPRNPRKPDAAKRIAAKFAQRALRGANEVLARERAGMSGPIYADVFERDLRTAIRRAVKAAKRRKKQ